MRKTEISKKTNHFTLLYKLWRSLPGSITIETALILPIFLFALLSVMYLTDAVRISSEHTSDLAEQAYKYAKYAYLGDKITGDTPISDALELIHDGDDIIDLVYRYRITVPFDLLGIYDPYALDRVRIRAFTGYDNTKHAHDDSTDEEMVYVTENGSVYHRSLGCSHLNLNIRSVDPEKVSKERANDGSRYYPCEHCCRQNEGRPAVVYITDDGNRYHTSLSCSGLKRTIHEVPLSRAGLPPCKECGK